MSKEYYQKEHKYHLSEIRKLNKAFAQAVQKCNLPTMLTISHELGGLFLHAELVASKANAPVGALIPFERDFKKNLKTAIAKCK